MNEKKLARARRAVLKAVCLARLGGVEGVTIQEVLGFLQAKPLLALGMRQGLSTAEAFRVVRRCQGEVSQAFTHTVIEAIEGLERARDLIVDEQAMIFLTERGRRTYEREGK